MRVGYFDLETTGLKGDVGRILCASIKDARYKKITTFRNDDISSSTADDSEITVLIRDMLETFHITVGWFSKGFDIAMLNTRLVKNGHATIRPGLHLDPIWYCKGWRGLNARSAKMKVMAEFFDLERKPDVDVDVWISASSGDRASMDILVKRCEADVRITQQLTERILDTRLVKNITSYP